MDFHRKYALLDPIPGNGASSYRGRQLLSGREVTVHFLPGDGMGNEALLSRIRALPPHVLSQLLEIGEHEGALYLVTIAPPYLHFCDWLPVEEPGDPPKPGPDAPTSSWNTGGPDAKPGEFTQFFLADSLRPDQSQQPPAVSIPQQAGPGEFTRMFQPTPPSSLSPAPPNPLAQDSSPSKLPAAAESLPALRDSTKRPGEFTSLFRVPMGQTSEGTDSAGAATEAFVNPQGSPSTGRTAPEGPSEYSRIIGMPSLARPASPSPTSGQVGGQQVSSPGPLQGTAPQAPGLPLRTEEKGGPKAAHSNLGRTVLFCLLSFLAGAALVFLILRR
jgi:hypothetical protein